MSASNPFEHNEALKSRIEGMFNSLITSFEAGSELSSATKGTERELFVSTFLSQIFPPHYRFSSGDITGQPNRRSGQIDIVLEFPQGFSIPFHPSGPRLFFAEGVAAAIEVKSDLVAQWDEVVSTGNKLRDVQRRFDPDYYEDMAEEIETKKRSYAGDNPTNLVASLRARGRSIPNRAQRNIPLFAVGFSGWKTKEKLEEKLKCGVVDGIFVIGSRLFSSIHGPAFASGTNSMIMFLEALETQLLKTTVPLPVLHNYRL